VGSVEGAAGRSALDVQPTRSRVWTGSAASPGRANRELREVPGVGAARANQLAAAFELGRRLVTRLSVGTLDDPGNLETWPTGSLPQMGRLEREELRVVLLNTKNVVLCVRTVYVGNVLRQRWCASGSCSRDAVRHHAAAIVVVHNHPSGDPAPSADDLHLTAECVAAGRLLDVAVLDHLIVATTRTSAFVIGGSRSTVPAGVRRDDPRSVIARVPTGPATGVSAGSRCAPVRASGLECGEQLAAYASSASRRRGGAPPWL
jgi:DNA repair protein RadC